MGGKVIEAFFKTFGNYFFPMALSVYLIFKIDRILTLMIHNQKAFQEVVVQEMKNIEKDILALRIDLVKKV